MRVEPSIIFAIWFVKEIGLMSFSTDLGDGRSLQMEALEYASPEAAHKILAQEALQW